MSNQFVYYIIYICCRFAVSEGPKGARAVVAQVLCQQRGGGGGGQNDGQSGSRITLPLLSLSLSLSARLQLVSNCLSLLEIHEGEMILLLLLSAAVECRRGGVVLPAVARRWRRLEHRPD